MSIAEFKKVKASKGSIARRKLKYGVGINDADYIVNQAVDGVRIMYPAYLAWNDMLRRSYSSKYHEKMPTYINVTVCSEWLTFSNFAAWFNNNHIGGYQLDKDLKKKGNKIYSPESCMFVPQQINSLMTDSGGSRGDYPLGVSLFKPSNKYQASIRIDNVGVYLGRFESPEIAHEIYKEAKNTEILRKCEQYPEFAVYLKQYLYEVEV